MSDDHFLHLPEPWQECLEAFLQHYTYRREDYRRILARFFSDPERSPADYTQADVRAFLARPLEGPRHRGQPMTPGTKDFHLQALVAFYTFAARYQVDGQPLYHKPTLPTQGIPYEGLKYYQRTRERYREQRRAQPPKPPASPREDFAHLPESWQAAISDFLASIRDRSGSEQSYQTYRSYLAQFFRFCGGKRPEDITKTDVLRFVQSPADAPRNRGGEASPATKNMRCCVLASFFTFASDLEVDGQPLYQGALPTRGIKHVKPTISHRAMTADELRRFFAVIDTSTLIGKRDFALFAVAFWSCRRRAEVCRLRWGDFEQTVIYDQDGTQRQGWQYRYISKGNQRRPKVAEMPGPAMAAILSYLEASGRLAAIKPEDAVFTSIHVGQGRPDLAGGMPLNRDYVGQRFRRYSARAGLSPTYTIHALRHTGARERYLMSHDILSVKEILGHQDIGTTFRYIGSMVSTGDSTARQLESRFAFLT